MLLINIFMYSHVSASDIFYLKLFLADFADNLNRPVLKSEIWKLAKDEHGRWQKDPYL